MQFKGRALFNLLKISLKEDPSLQIEPWQMENYRDLTTDEIFARLEELGIALNEESFLIYAESNDSPEELLECLWVKEEDPEGQDKAYLLVFELWRRLARERQSLSIFCDQLDQLIMLYDEQQLKDDEPLQRALSELEDVLDRGVDQGASPQEIFQTVLGYMAYDLEQFLYDYTLDLMEESNEIYASELVDAMTPYVTEKKWFDLLKARLFALSNSPETFIFVARILEQAEEEPDLEFLMELAHFLVQIEEDSLFLGCIKVILPILETREDLIEVLGLILDFFRYLDKEPSAQRVQSYIQQRQKAPNLDVTEKDIHAVTELLIGT